MGDYQDLLFEQQDGVATITINRPESANSLTLRTCQELMDVAIRCDEAADVRAAILTGSGRMFCAGADLTEFGKAGSGLSTLIKEITTYLHVAVSRFARMEAPLVCSVNGTAAGGGMSLSLVGDMALAAESARFTMAYSRIGLTPDGSSTYFLAKLVGMRRAKELSLTNRMLSAAEAAEWGLVNRVVPDDELAEEAQKLAAQLAAGPTQSIGAAKRLYLSGSSETLETQLELETREIAAAGGRPQGAEGIAAFLEKRDADFGKS